MKKLVSVLVLLLLVTSFVSAHFLVIYTPDSVVEGSEVPFIIVFTHPFNAGYTMNIGENEAGEIKGFEEFFSVHKGKRTDLTADLEEITFTSLENSGTAYELVLKRDNGYRGGGDWVIIGVPAPYYEGASDIYIQQIVKFLINKGEIATDWDSRVAEGYPEIIPFVKPYAVWVGGVFRGMVVDCEGKPVPEAVIEVEYINYDLDMEDKKFSGDPKIKKEGHGAAVIIADDQGNFSFVPPKAGYWGFSALVEGGEKTFNGKELSQAAVLWIEAEELK